jgi:hypothetical protein
MSVAVLAAAAGFFATDSFSRSIEFTGELSASVTRNNTEAEPVYTNARYTPELFIEYGLGESNSLGLRASGNAIWSTRFESFDRSQTDSDADIYRLWLRFSAPQWEARFGKQKISFGAATLLRPLMWFDSIDPRDPLQRSDGVWALLFRYYFLNNVNVWAWGLFGNEDPKGWEMLATDDEEPEFGGRIQVPVPRGEIGAAYHRRALDISRLAGAGGASAGPSGGGVPAPAASIHEDRFGIDAKWDIGVGAWIEGALYKRDNDVFPDPYRHLATVGVDYTFGIGEGFTAVGEHFIAVASGEAFGAGTQNTISGVSFTYPWGLVDNFAVILYYDYDAEDVYRFVDWRRSYDRWTFHAIGFMNPKTASFFPSGQGSGMLQSEGILQGNGLQILVVFNH